MLPLAAGLPCQMEMLDVLPLAALPPSSARFSLLLSLCRVPDRVLLTALLTAPLLCSNFTKQLSFCSRAPSNSARGSALSCAAGSAQTHIRTHTHTHTQLSIGCYIECGL